MSKGTIRDLEAKLHQARVTKSFYAQQLETLEGRISAALARVDAIRAEGVALPKKLKRQVALCASLVTELHRLSTADRLRNQIRGAETRITRLRKEERDARKKVGEGRNGSQGIVQSDERE